jgi:hypothetical protein
MKNHPDQLDYFDLQTIVANARLQRSLAVGDAIVGLVAVILSGLSRAANAVKSGVGASRSRETANSASILEASGHR